MPRAAKRIGVVGFDGVTALDLIGPMEAFSAVHLRASSERDAAGYHLTLLGLSTRPFVAESGVSFRPDCALRDAGEFDTLIVPGGSGLQDPERAARLAAWLGANAARFRRVIAICTGVYALAPTGLLDGRRVTTHWRHARDLAARFPRLHVVPDALFLRDGPFHTSAGVTAGMDLTLSLIEDDYGSAVALGVARELVTYLRRPGGQGQFAEPQPRESGSDPRLEDLPRWIAGNMTEELSVEVLARRFELSPRHFTRLFTKAFGTSPACLIEDVRLDEAKRLLIEPAATVESVSAAIGFRNPDTFRRTFLRRIGISPNDYRRRFAPRMRLVRGQRPVEMEVAAEMG